MELGPCWVFVFNLESPWGLSIFMYHGTKLGKPGWENSSFNLCQCLPFWVFLLLETMVVSFLSFKASYGIAETTTNSPAPWLAFHFLNSVIIPLPVIKISGLLLWQLSFVSFSKNLEAITSRVPARNQKSFNCLTIRSRTSQGSLENSSERQDAISTTPKQQAQTKPHFDDLTQERKFRPTSH